VAGFTDITRESEILHRHQRGAFDAKLSNIMPWISSIGSAAAVSDYDLDGDLDLYVTSSRVGFPNALFRNDGGLRFTEVGALAGVAAVNDSSGVSMDVAFADLDNDGDDDLYVVEWGKNRMLRNDGDGTFTNITDSSGADDSGNGNCVLPFDYDGDGLLDIFVCNYYPSVNLTALDSTRIMHDSFEAATNGGLNVLYRNLGDLRFENVAHQLNLDDGGWSLDAGISDIDNDGDLDVYVANDFGQDKLYLAIGGGRFTDVTERAIGHDTFKGMNVDFGDFNSDGFTDCYVTNITTAEYLKEGNMLHLNAGDGTFSNVAAATGTFDGGWGWCGRFFDFDQDGHLDILTVNGFVTAGPTSYWEDLANVAVNPDFDPAEVLEWPAMGSHSLSGSEATRLFRNRGDGAFEEVAKKYGIADSRDGRGIALGDFDEDGDLDVYLAHQDAYGALYRNDVGNIHHFIVLTLVGTKSNRNAIGARIQLTASDGASGRALKLTREVNGVNGYASQSSYRVHFGLGQSERVERLTVFWPGGVVQDFRDLPVDRHFKIVEEGDPATAKERSELYFSSLRAPSQMAQTGGDLPPRGAVSPALLLDLEEKLQRKPRNVRLANQYRSLCVDGAQFDRAVAFFRRLVSDYPGHTAVRLQLALALVDKIPFLGRDVLRQGSSAKESLSELRWVADVKPDSYALNYISGMNHLYWPASLRHFDDAVKHFKKCLELHKKGAPGEVLWPYYAEVYCALGDSHVKGRRYDAARQVWGDGLALFPAKAALRSRLELDDKDLLDTITQERGLRKRIDTRLSFLYEENNLGSSEKRLRVEPGDRALLNAYRMEAYELEEVPRARAFIEKLIAVHPGVAEPRLHLALVLADEVNTIGMASAAAFQLAGEVLAELKKYRVLAPEDWLGPYFEGICYLFKPQSAESASAAVAAFMEAARLTRREDGSPRVAYTGLALGDALVCARQAESALGIWRESLSTFPHARGLKVRIESPAESLRTLVRADYVLARGIPTDLDALVDKEAELLTFEKSLGEVVKTETAVRYRTVVRHSGDVERAVRFFQELLEKSPRSANIRVALALAYLDRIPDRDLGSVRKGLLSSEALNLMEEVGAVHPDSWGIHYVIGLIHLHWFTKQNHLRHAVESFEHCIALQKGREEKNACYAHAYRALGDAYVKGQGTARAFVRGRKVWRAGRKLFAEDRGLEERMGLTALMVNRYVEEARSWSAIHDTALLSRVIGHLADFPGIETGG
jgi:tetratricopeptide (TPR) repeat protein